MKNKKGIALEEAFGAVLTLVLVAVLVIVAVYLFTLIRSVPTYVNVAVTNESIVISGTGAYLSNYTKCGFANPVLTRLFNATSGAEFNVANATVSSTGLVTNSSATLFSSAYISYTYDWRGETCEASDTMVTQFATFPALIGLVGTIIFLALVIGVLVTSFMFRRRAGA